MDPNNDEYFFEDEFDRDLSDYVDYEDEPSGEDSERSFFLEQLFPICLLLFIQINFNVLSFQESTESGYLLPWYSCQKMLASWSCSASSSES